MLTYKNLYCSLVRSMSEAIDLYDTKILCQVVALQH